MPPEVNPICIVYGAIISVVVSALKKISWVKNNPKLVAFFATVIVNGLPIVLHGGMTKETIVALISCIVVGVSGSVATHEVVVGPLGARMGLSTHDVKKVA